MSVTINCDMGESYAIYSFGDDEDLMPLVDTVATWRAGSTRPTRG